jgi:tetratricopeptide (TPR) repeat protein
MPRFAQITIVLLLSLPLLAVRAQEIPRDFVLLTDSVLRQKPATYQDLDSFVRPFRRDTVLITYFIDQCRQAGYLDGLSYSYNQLGTFYRNTSDYEKSIDFHNKALDAATTSGNTEFRIFSLNMLGVAYRRQDAIKTALDYNQEALRLAESIENPSMGILRSKNVSLNSIGNIYQALEQYERALAHYQQSYRLEEALGNKLGMAINLQNSGECLEAQGKLDEALEAFRSALELDTEIGSERGKAICGNSISGIYVKQGRYADAIELMDANLPMALQTRDMHIIAPAYNTLGRAYLNTGNWKLAEENLKQGLQIASENQLLRGICVSYELLSELASKKGDFEAALGYLKESEKYRTQVTNDVNIKYVNDVILRYESEKQMQLAQRLRQENEIVNLKLRRNQNTLLVGALLLVLFSLMMYTIFRQNRLNSEKKVLALEQSRLRSQMNPHFLFNSLNSIKHFIINNEQKNAVQYLNKFSKLVRKILEASSEKDISLQEELETVNLYMNIENMRFNHEIDFEVVVAPDINPASVKVPSLVLQPFLENALWHGLSSKKGKKTIHLEVTRNEPDYIEIAIRDNGIGREAAEKVKLQKTLNRKSVGIPITRERLANFSRVYQNSFDLSIRDILGADGAVQGTEVLLKIPTV